MWWLILLGLLVLVGGLWVLWVLVITRTRLPED